MEKKRPNYSLGETGPNAYSKSRFTLERKKEFCRQLEISNGHKLTAARLIGIHLNTVKVHIVKDPEFAQMVEEAMQAYRDSLVNEVHRRGVDGVPKKLYFQGKRIYDVDLDTGEKIPASQMEYSDAMLSMLVKRHCPEFTDKQIVETTTVDMGVADISKMTKAQRAKLRELMDTEGEEPSA